jgi:ketosteroid isomerase-like protein
MLIPGARSEDCGGELVRRTSVSELVPVSKAARTAGSATLDDLAAAVWVQAYDAAWLGRDWRALERCFAPDVVLTSPAFTSSIAGREAVLAHMRAMMSGVRVHEYNATDLKGHSSGAVGVITYRWQLDWTAERERRAISGRDILMLRASADDWQLVWRVQVG